MVSNYTQSEWFPWLYGGVDFNLDGNGGPECFNYLTLTQRFWETALILSTSVLEIWIALKYISSSTSTKLQNGKMQVTVNNHYAKKNGVILKPSFSNVKWPSFQITLLALLAVVFGIEIAYKVVTRTCIFLLNPCHILTISQMYLLTVDNQKPSPTARTVFRIHLHMLSGALLALVLPVTNTRHLLYEPESYWVHHILLYATPIYLIACGNNFVPEPFNDCWWPMLSIGTELFYHFTLLQGLSMFTMVNLNNMLCPAVSDPFEGANYRLWAFVHQHLLIAIHGKLYHLLALAVLKLLTGIEFCATFIQNLLPIRVVFPKHMSRIHENGKCD
uniref:Transmembrane protein 164 n=1 Tax=Phallusia mammillata TaxID=59560 RepID=A0A6F9DVI7_9ASCI|nr:transmembrane protein 164 [Phallusia mammillata]